MVSKRNVHSSKTSSTMQFLYNCVGILKKQLPGRGRGKLNFIVVANLQSLSKLRTKPSNSYFKRILHSYTWMYNCYLNAPPSSTHSLFFSGP